MPNGSTDPTGRAGRLGRTPARQSLGAGTLRHVCSAATAMYRAARCEPARTCMSVQC